MSTQHDTILVTNKLEKQIQDFLRENNLPAMAIRLNVKGYKRHSLEDIPCSEHEYYAVMDQQNNSGEISIEITQLKDFKYTYSL
ncbi:MAG: hypothetical protein V4708_16375 [Bacteroidota bacterium]